MNCSSLLCAIAILVGTTSCKNGQVATAEDGPAVVAAHEDGPAVVATAEDGPAVVATAEDGATVVATAEDGPTVVAAHEEPSGFAFRWDTDARATVTEETLKKGRRTKVRSRLSVQARSGWLAIRQSDYKIFEMAGFDLTAPGAEGKFKEAASKLPDVVYFVERDGIWRGYKDTAEAEVAMAEHDAEILAKLQKDPRLLRLVNQRMRDTWAAWVESWIGLAIRPGESLAVEVQLDAETSSHGTLSRLQDQKGRAHVRLRTTLEGDAAKRALGSAVAGFAKDGGADLDQLSDQFTVKRTTTLEAVFQPQTLRPRSVEREVTTDISYGSETRKEVESHTWAFAWDDE